MTLYAMMHEIDPAKNDGCTLAIMLMQVDAEGQRSVHSIYHGTCARAMCQHPDLVGVHHVSNGDYSSPIIETDCLSLAEALEATL